MLRSLILTTLVVIVAPASAATPDSYTALDRRSAAACRAASGLQDAKIGPAVRFSDRFLVDARTVTGRWPQPHMKNAAASLLCLYNRRTQRAETQEAATPGSATATIKDIWWRAEDIGGRGIVDRSEVTLYLGSDGKIGGRSGCNNYSVKYRVEGTSLKLYPPMIGTRMMCPPEVMDQETRYRTLLETATGVTVAPDGALIIDTPRGPLRFTRS